MRLKINGRVVLRAGGPNNEGFHRVFWDLRTFRGQTAVIEIEDNATDAWGHVMVDDFLAELQIRLAHQSGGASLDLFVAIEGKHGPLWFELDSGNTQPVLIAPHAFAELGLEPLPVGRTGKAELPIVGLGKVACDFVSKELIYDGLLNAAFFQTHVVTMDLAQGRAWVTPQPRR